MGYRLGGHLKRVDTGQSVQVEDHGSVALALDLLSNQGSQYELFYGRESTALSGTDFPRTSIKVEYLHVGGTVPLEETAHLKPYFGGGLGVTRLSPDPAAGVDETRFSISLSVGLRVPVNRHFSLRFEGRGFLTPIPTDSAFFCRSDQTGALCAVRVRGAVFFQADLLAGAAFVF